MIDGELIDDEYDTYLVDENNLLTIIIDSLKIVKENMDLIVIKILTISSKNISDRNKIRIR